MNHYTLKVEEVIYELDDCVTIKFKQPSLKKLKYKVGQYITLIVNIGGRKYKRPYSISSVFGISQTIDITIKKVNLGIVSSHLVSNINVGQSIEVMDAMGDFIYEPSSEAKPHHVTLWGAGSGITPLMAIIKYTLHFEKDTSIDLIYSNKNEDSIVYKDELLNLAKTYPHRFKHLKVLTSPRTKPEEYFGIGRINREFIIKNINALPQISGRHYICGPDDMKDVIVDALLSCGVANSNIYFESFVKKVNRTEIKDVFDRNVTVAFKEKEYLVSVNAGKSILEAALDQGLDLPYSCQNGQCLACKARYTSGDVRIISLENINELNPDECLLCCTYPLTDNLKFFVTD